MNLPTDMYFDKRLLTRNLKSKLVTEEGHQALLASMEDCVDMFEYVNMDDTEETPAVESEAEAETKTETAPEAE